MFNTIISMLGDCLLFPLHVFDQFVFGDFKVLYITCLTIFLVYRFLLRPILGAEVSDMADNVRFNANLYSNYYMNRKGK